MRSLKTELSKIIPTNHHEEFYRDVSVDCSIEKHGGGADQSFKNSCDINIIMEQYAKTGMLPQITQIPARYSDNSDTPSLEEAFNIANRAYDAFMGLPPAIRKLMDNDPSKLELFINDESNHALLKQHGIIVEKQTTEQTKPTEEIK